MNQIGDSEVRSVVTVGRSDNRSGAKLGPRSQRRWLGRVFLAAVLLLVLSGSVVALIALMHTGRARKYQVHMVTDLVPIRKTLAERIRAEGHHHGLDLVLTSKHYGALEGLNEVNAPNEIKLALIPAGITAGEYTSVRTVTTLASEPLHILVRPSLAGKGFAALKGKRVHLGPVTSCSHHLAREVLEFVGLTPAAESSATGYIPETTAPEDLQRELADIELLDQSMRIEAIKKLPDAVVFIAPLPSHLAKHLVRAAGYQFIPMPFGEAFCLDRMNPPNPTGVRVDRAALTPSVIPPSTYSGDPPVPASACPTISAPLLLVAQDDTDPEAIYRLLEVVYDSSLTSTLHPPDLREQFYSFPPHAGTERYLHRHDPLITAESATTLGKAAGGLGAFVSGVIALYTLLRFRRLRRFETYYREIAQIEQVASGIVEDSEAPTTPDAMLPYLQERLSALRSRVLEDFTDGGLMGEGLVAGIIAAIHDTRSTLPLALAARKERRKHE
jgi:TRAP-type uncharacterized transport system substrate-binding protein